MPFYFDEYGLPVEQYKDAGDSAMRCGVRAQSGLTGLRFLRMYYADGVCVRHPFQKPWNNPKNFTVDQLTVLLAGMNTYGEIQAMFDIFKKYAARGFVGMNTERDWPGTTKYPWPHKVQDYVSGGKDGKIPKGAPYWRMFDGPDLLFLRHDLLYIWAKRVKSRWQYVFAALGPLQFLFGVLLNALKCKLNDPKFKDGIVEQNQIISLANLYGGWAMRLYRKVTPKWAEHVMGYWNVRDESPYSDSLINLVNWVSRENQG